MAKKTSIMGRAHPLRDSIFFMTNPCYSLNKKGDKRLTFERDKFIIELTSSATDYIVNAWDWDVMLPILGEIAKFNDKEGSKENPTLKMEVGELLRILGKSIDGKNYHWVTAALRRLKSTEITVKYDDPAKRGKYEGHSNYLSYFALVEEAERKTFEIKISDWLWEIVKDNKELLAIDKEYLAITGGIEKSLYRLCRKFVGKRRSHTISFEEAQNFIGSKASPKKFKESLRGIIKKGHLSQSFTLQELKSGVLTMTNPAIRDMIPIENLQGDMFEDLSPDIVEIKEFLKTKIKGTEWNSWIAPCRFQAVGKELKLICPTRFICNWNKENYKKLWEDIEIKYGLNLIMLVG